MSFARRRRIVFHALNPKRGGPLLSGPRYSRPAHQGFARTGWTRYPVLDLGIISVTGRVEPFA